MQISDSVWIYGGTQSKRIAQPTVPQQLLLTAAQRVALVHWMVEGADTWLHEEERLQCAIIYADELYHALVALDSDCGSEHDFSRAEIHGC